MPKDPDDFLRETDHKHLEFKLDAVERHASELLTDKLKAEAKIARLEAEIARLGGQPPDHRESIQRNIAELKRVETLYRERKGELEAQIQDSIRKLGATADDAKKARAILDGLQDKVTELMVVAIEKSSRRRQFRTIALSFSLGVLSSFVAAWLWSVATRSPASTPSFNPPAIHSPPAPASAK